jgi:hypothetical protein
LNPGLKGDELNGSRLILEILTLLFRVWNSVLKSTCLRFAPIVAAERGSSKACGRQSGRVSMSSHAGHARWQTMA